MRTPITLLATLLLNATHAQPGTLDVTFGSGGETLISVGTPYDLMWDLAIQPDDKIVVAGSIGTIGGGAFQDAVILRFTADGAPDTTFGNNGQVIWTGTGGNDAIRGVDIDPDGRIVVAGETQVNGGETQMFILRLLEDGSFDNSFSGDGVLTRSGSVYEDGSYGRDVACLADGSILVAGYMHFNLSMPYYNAVTLWKCTSTGGLYPGFGGSGSWSFSDLFNDNLPDVANCMALRPDGSLVVGTATDNAPDQRLGVADFDSDGNHLSANFEWTYNLTANNDAANGIVLLPDGRYVMAGPAGPQAALMGLLATGTPDGTFGNSGRVDVQLGSDATALYDALLQPWDKVLITGSFNNGGTLSMYLGRYNADGSVDATFGNNGFATHLPGGVNGDGRAIGLQSDGRIIVGGIYGSGGNNDMYLVRYTNDVATDITRTAPAPVLRAYPSPFRDALTLQGTSANGRLELLDALGRAVHSAPTTAGRTELNIDLPTGVYTIRYQHGAKPGQVIRVVKE